jgi:hypothetical protein
MTIRSRQPGQREQSPLTCPHTGCPTIFFCLTLLCTRSKCLSSLREKKLGKISAPDPPELKNPRNRHCKWRGWASPKIIVRKYTDIENSGLKYFALFPNTSNNGCQLFELHTGKDTMGDSQVATLLGHDLQAHSSWLELKHLTKEDKFSDNTNVTFVFGDPAFNPDAFLINRGVEPRIVSLKPIGECFSEIEEDDVSQKSTERMRSPYVQRQLGSSASHFSDQTRCKFTTPHLVCCNFLCMTTKTNPEARYSWHNDPCSTFHRLSSHCTCVAHYLYP